ncbi:MAG: glycosyltransferase [Bacteroidetes bacterium]|nr:glycosyltransferase [Bacteroidota bacterium]
MTPYLTERAMYPPQIHMKPSPLLGLVVVIPCHDEDFLLLSLMSLRRCDRPLCDVEVIVVVNESEDALAAVREKNRSTYEQAQRWSQDNSQPWLRFHILHVDHLPKKHAGVGLARKIGMDEACYRFAKMGNQRGVIACFDADSRCERNYLQAIHAHFTENPRAQACGIRFEHPLSGPDFPDEVYHAITLYELHLRYYVLAQRWSGIQHAEQTIGSSMAVRCDAYQQQGGMNRRQAGEDFYFLHKFIPLGGFAEITATKVIPSPRPSHRVPFGTGRAVVELLKNGGKYLTYNPRCFEDLQVFLSQELHGLHELEDVEMLYARLPESVSSFLRLNNFEKKWVEIQLNTSTAEAFQKRFWRWFDAFLVMKYVHFARENYYLDVAVTVAAGWLMGKLGLEIGEGTARGMLEQLRNIKPVP